MRFPLPGALLWCLILPTCEHETGPAAGEPCNTMPLPLSGGVEAPLVSAVTLAVEGGDIIARVTVTDPQGPEDLARVMQRLSVFTDRRCEGAPLELVSDVDGAGVPENFGIVVTFSDNQALYGAIVSGLTWPVAVAFSDVHGNRTAGRVQAPVQ